MNLPAALLSCEIYVDVRDTAERASGVPERRELRRGLIRLDQVECISEGTPEMPGTRVQVRSGGYYTVYEPYDAVAAALVAYLGRIPALLLPS